MARQYRHRPHHLWLALLPLLLASGLILAGPSAAAAETITVTSTDLSLATDGKCTLGEALDNFNNNALIRPDCPSTNIFVAGKTVKFNIPTFQDLGCNFSTFVCTIRPDVAYQILTPLTIDGYTQTNASPNTLAIGNDAVIRIQIQPSGSAVGGLRVRANDVTIRGLAIGGFPEYGIRVENAARARIIGCFIGIDATDSASNSNDVAGVYVDAPATDTIIGGTSPADRNVISNNHTTVFLGAGIFLAEGSSGATIQNNYIGTDAAGTGPRNNGIGLHINGNSNVVGGTSPAARNVITSNHQNIVIEGHVNTLQGNYIGLKADGVSAFDPVLNKPGITISGILNTIGGTQVGSGNSIIGNANGGVAIASGTSNQILANSIFANGDGFGIEFAPFDTHTTPNDFFDEDTGPNNRQNMPILGRASVGTNTVVAGRLDSMPLRSYRIELFANRYCNKPSGYGGETFLGFITVKTSNFGFVDFTSSYPPLPVGQTITATATDLNTGDTSEFSNCVAIAQAGFTQTPITGPTTEANEGSPSDASFTMRLNTVPIADVSITLAVSDPTEGAIVGPTTLTFTPANALTPQTVQLVGVDDLLDDGDVAYAIVFGAATSNDAAYVGLKPPDMTVPNVDNDDPPTPTPTPTSPPAPTPPNVTTSVARAGPDRLLVTVTARAGQTLQRLDWTLPPNARIEAQTGTPLPTGLVLSPGTTSASFVLIRTGGTSVTLPFTVSGSFGTWQTFVGGGPNAF